MIDQAPPLTYRIEQLAQQLGISRVTIHRLNSSGKLPKPIRLGRVVIWPVEEIQAWLAAGSPDRQRWEALRAARASKR